MSSLRGYFRSLDPKLPRSVWTMEAGGLANAFGNGVTFPFVVIYLHNVRGLSLGTAGLVLAAHSAVGLVVTPGTGLLIDRFGGRVTLATALGLMAIGWGCFPLIDETWHAFALAAVAGAGNSGFWPSQSTLLAGLTPQARRHAAYALQRVSRNLGIGLGGVAGGLIAVTSEPSSFTVLFLVDADTFLVFAAILGLVPEPELAQLPVAKLLEGRRRMKALAFMTGLWASAWLIVLAGGTWLEATSAAAVFALAVVIFGLGECFQGPTQGALVADLALPRLRGRYMALSAISWDIGFILGPSVGGFVLERAPLALWPGAAVVCLVAGVGALALERQIPSSLRLTPA